MVQLESCIIVTNKYTSIATIRYNDCTQDKIISANRPLIYALIEMNVKQVTGS